MKKALEAWKVKEWKLPAKGLSLLKVTSTWADEPMIFYQVVDKGKTYEEAYGVTKDFFEVLLRLAVKPKKKDKEVFFHSDDKGHFWKR
jgi:hypothetical protein